MGAIKFNLKKCRRPTSERCSDSFSPQFLALCRAGSRSLPCPTFINRSNMSKSHPASSPSPHVKQHCVTDRRISAEVDSHHQPVGRQHELLSQLHRFHGNLRSISAINSHQEPCGETFPSCLFPSSIFFSHYSDKFPTKQHIRAYLTSMSTSSFLHCCMAFRTVST